MDDIDPRLERIGAGPVLGHLTSATRLEDGAAPRAGKAGDLHADAELAIHLGRDVEARADRAAVLDAIDGFGAALEIVDLIAGPIVQIPAGPGDQVTADLGPLGRVGLRIAD